MRSKVNLRSKVTQMRVGDSIAMAHLPTLANIRHSYYAQKTQKNMIFTPDWPLMTSDEMTVKFGKNPWHRPQLFPKDQTCRTSPMVVTVISSTSVYVFRSQVTLNDLWWYDIFYEKCYLPSDAMNPSKSDISYTVTGRYYGKMFFFADFRPEVTLHDLWWHGVFVWKCYSRCDAPSPKSATCFNAYRRCNCWKSIKTNLWPSVTSKPDVRLKREIVPSIQLTELYDISENWHSPNNLILFVR